MLYKHIGKRFLNHKVCIKDINFGTEPVIIAGPCSIESEEQITRLAPKLKGLGVDILRGGAYKPRTNPESFQGLEEKGLKFLARAGKKAKMPIVSEIPDAEHIELFLKYVDIIQVGSRNMHNYWLLKKLGKIDRPVLLKRGMSATINEFLHAAEYIVKEGNQDVILCERGIRTFETYTRNTLDLSAVAIIKNITNLPIVVDPSHGTGKAELVKPMSKAALAVGADGLMIEVHQNPEKALSDNEQTLNLKEFEKLLKEIKKNLILWHV